MSKPKALATSESAHESFIRDVRLAMESYYSAAYEAIRESKRKKDQAKTRPARRKRSR